MGVVYSRHHDNVSFDQLKYRKCGRNGMCGVRYCNEVPALFSVCHVHIARGGSEPNV
jgi:hypothetical protein